MTTAFKCTNCGFQFRVEDRFLGRTITCRKCTQPISLTRKRRRPVVGIVESSPSAESVDNSTSKLRQNETGRGKQSRSRPVTRVSSKTVSTFWYRVSSGFLVSVVTVGLFAVFLNSNGRALSDATENELAVNHDHYRPQFHAQKAILTALPQKTAAQIEAEKEAKRLAEEIEAARTTNLEENLMPFLSKYCFDCHSADSREAGIRVDELLDVNQLQTERKLWERVYRIVNAGAMPPADHDPLPSPDELKLTTEFLYDELYNFDCNLVDNPGRSTVQRLNRSEYNNTIRDLFGVDIRPADDFPSDDVGDGFDNIGDVLSLPPLLMEKYLNAAEQVAAAVVDGTDYSKPQTITVTGDRLKSSVGSESVLEGFRAMFSEQTLSTSFKVPATGEYKIQCVVGADQAGEEKARFALKLGTTDLETFEIKSHRNPEHFEWKQNLEFGTAEIGIAFLNDFWNAETKADRNMGVAEITLHGPLNGELPPKSKGQNRIVTTAPAEGQTVLDGAMEVVRPLLGRAFRRPVTDEEVFRYASLARHAVEDLDETYASGLSLAVQAILVAPDFLFRLERDPASGKTERQLNDFEVASRLSYFLWSTMPDEELMDLARTAKLLQPDSLRSQITRMLADDRADALVQNFAAQWLNLRNLADVTPNPKLFDSFDEDLRNSMRQETELLFSTIMKEDRSIEDLLTADFTFVDERLANHYGITGIEGEQFQRVSLSGTNRAGVLTHASILTLTSNPSRTSPVKRGKWIMANIFDEAPPPPPPNVPELEATAEASPDVTLREQLAIHREDPGCASCHKVMDPLGLGLENFDAIGRWRTEEDGKPIDASGSLPSGESFVGSLELIDIVKKRREKFLRTVSEKLLVYAIGRGTLYYDKCTVDDCLDLLEDRDYRFSALVEAIVLSDPFLKRRGPEPEVASK